MKKLQLLTVFMVVFLFGISNVNAQSSPEKEDRVAYKTSLKESPKQVRQTLQNYSGYKISSKVTYKRTGKGKVYRFKLDKDQWSRYLLVNEKGKVVGIETGEHAGAKPN